MMVQRYNLIPKMFLEVSPTPNTFPNSREIKKGVANYFYCNYLCNFLQIKAQNYLTIQVTKNNIKIKYIFCFSTFFALFLNFKI